MSETRAAGLGVATLLLMATLACAVSTPPASRVISPLPAPPSPAQPASSTSAPAPSTAAPGVSTAAVPSGSPTAEFTRLVRFDEANDAFSLRYPAAFEDIERVEGVGDDAVAFSTSDGTASFTVAFFIQSSEPLTDRAWRQAIRGTAGDVVLKFGHGFASDFEQTDRKGSDVGDHNLYLAGDFDQGKRRGVLWLEESEGILGALSWVMPADQWDVLKPIADQSIQSFSWAPETVREQVGKLTPTAGSTAEGTLAAVLPFEKTPTRELPTEAGTEATPTPENLAETTATVEPRQTTTFDDPNDVFRLDYPAALSEMRQFDPPGYGYDFSDAQGTHFIAIYFDALASTALSEEEWASSAKQLLTTVLHNFAEDAVETQRSPAETGHHLEIVEAESESQAAHRLIMLAESQGVLALMMAEAPSQDWPAWSGPMRQAMDSFVWSAVKARRALPAATATPSRTPIVPTPTDTPPPTLTGTPTPVPPTALKATRMPTASPTVTAAPTSSKWWPGQPELPPDKACFLVTNNLGEEITFNLGLQTQKVPPKGSTWFVADPGTTTWSADTPSGWHRDGGVALKPGCDPHVNELTINQ